MSDFNLPLSARVDFAELARNKVEYTLTLPKAMFERLEGSCKGLLSDADLTVRFYKDLQGLNTIEGTISIKVNLMCERCLQTFEHELKARFKSTCDYQKAKSLRIEDKLDFADLDEDGMFALYEYLEDCLLLELPSVPRHEDEEQCGIKGDNWTYGEVPKAENPFAALKGMLKEQGEKH